MLQNRLKTGREGLRETEKLDPRMALPRYFAIAASKGFSISVRVLESTLVGDSINVDSKRLSGN
jgi:hypothetical protein